MILLINKADFLPLRGDFVGFRRAGYSAEFIVEPEPYQGDLKALWKEFPTERAKYKNTQLTDLLK